LRKRRFRNMLGRRDLFSVADVFLPLQRTLHRTYEFICFKKQITNFVRDVMKRPVNLEVSTSICNVPMAARGYRDRAGKSRACTRTCSTGSCTRTAACRGGSPWPS
jgi:hypothetical protein